MKHTPYTTPVPNVGNISDGSFSPRFRLGNLVATPGVIESIGLDSVMPYVFMHMTGHWGDLDEEDQRSNDWSVDNGARILSQYYVEGQKFWVITEHDRSVTTLLLPDEY